MKQQRRLNLPSGEQPAARVVRRQPQQQSASTSNAHRVAVPSSAHKVAVPHVSLSLSSTSRQPISENTPSGSTKVEQSELSGLSVLGAVVERPRRRKNHPTQGRAVTTASLSVDVNLHPAQGTRSLSKIGIPTLHLPLGTFTHDKQVLPPFSECQPSCAHPVPTSYSSNGAVSSRRSGATSEDTRKNHVAPSASNQSLSNASATDAQSMLESMTVEEIHESIEELTTQLDPTALAFLKRRGQRSKVQMPVVPMSESKPPVQSERHGEYANSKQRTHDSLDHTASADKSTTSEYDSVAAEKSKIATALTSVQTHEDLDAVYLRYNPMDDTTEAIGRSIQTISDEPSTSLNDFALACELLRSTSSAQTLWACRVICRRLLNIKRGPSSHRYQLRPLGAAFIDHDRDAEYASPAWPFPKLLPVSLRCLLDATHATTSRGTGASMLHVTYVLQALCTMLQLRECSDHAVDLSWTETEDGNDGEAESAAVYYQQECFDDDVPLLPLSALYAPAPSQTAPRDGCKSDLDGAVFVPSSSSGAVVDGEAFIRDPSWTLLSRMRILPRLAQLLRQGHDLMTLYYLDQKAAVNPNMSPQVGQNNTLSIEALSAICSILAMVGQRSPGAASAMAQHPTLMDDLVAMTLLYSDGSARLSAPDLALPTIRLFCVLNRQSIEAASALCHRLTETSSFLLQMIQHSVSSATNGSTSSRAQFALHRWTLIMWRTFLRLGFAIDIIPPVLALATPILTQSAVTSASIVPDLQSCFTSFLIFAGQLSSPGKVDNEMATSLGHMIQGSSLEHLTLKRLTQLPDDTSLLNCDVLRFIASDLRFLNAVTIYRESMGSSPIAERESTASAYFLSSIIEVRSTGDVAKAALRLAFTPSFPNTHEMSEQILRFEACACTFVESVVSLTLTLRHQNRANGNKELEFHHTLQRWLLQQLEQIMETPVNPSSLAGSAISVFETARCRWLNMLHTIVVCFLCDESSISLEASCIPQAVAFATFGRLDCGDELMATALINSLDLLSDKTSASMNLPSLLSNIIKKELSEPSNRPMRIECGTSLYLGLWALFGSPESQFIQVPSDETSMGQVDSVGFLPIGAFWLWKLLSSLAPATDQSLAGEPTVATLRIVGEIESNPSRTPSFQAIRMLSTGPKLYYLMSVCLQDETVLARHGIVTTAEKLFDQLFRRTSTSDIVEFAIACRMHICPRSMRDDVEHGTFEALNEEKIKAVLEPMQVVDTGFSPTTIRSLEAYAEDLCKAFLGSGAQYPFLAKAIRMFLSHGFPTKLRCAVVRQLYEGVHLLTLTDDVDLNDILPRFFAGGMPSVDSSHRDSTDLLDCIASVYRKGVQLRWDDIFFVSWATGMLARSLGIAASQAFSMGQAAMKNRMESLDPAFANRVIVTAASWFCSTGSLKDLVTATLTIDLNSDESASLVCLDCNGDVTWEKIVDHFSGMPPAQLPAATK